MKNYQAVVIGSGTGGLCVAARLAHAGLKVLVLERLPFIGGRFSSLEHKGILMTTGAVSVECGSSLEQTFREVGADFDVRRPQPRVRYRIDGRDYETPDRGGLKFLISLVTGNEKETETILRALRDPSLHPQAGSEISVKDWLRQLTANQGVLDIFQSLCGSTFSVNIAEASMVEFLKLLQQGGFSNFGFPPGGNIALVESLAEVIKKQGGEIWLRSEVSKIQVNNGTATGVIGKKEGKDFEISSSFVICDAGPHKTVELAGLENFGNEYLKNSLERMKPSCSLLLEIISAKPLTDFPGVLMTVGARRTAFIVAQTVCCPEISRSGKHLTTVLGTLELTEPLDVRGQFELLMEDARENIPDLDRQAEDIMMRSFYGEWPGFRARPGLDAPQETPICGLYNVGDGVKTPGHVGLGGCAESARIVAEKVLLQAGSPLPGRGNIGDKI